MCVPLWEMVVSTKEMTVGRRRKAAWVGADLSYLSLCTLSFSMPVECGFKSTNVVRTCVIYVLIFEGLSIAETKCAAIKSRSWIVSRPVLCSNLRGLNIMNCNEERKKGPGLTHPSGTHTLMPACSACVRACDQCMTVCVRQARRARKKTTHARYKA